MGRLGDTAPLRWLAGEVGDFIVDGAVDTLTTLLGEGNANAPNTPHSKVYDSPSNWQWGIGVAEMWATDKVLGIGLRMVRGLGRGPAAAITPIPFAPPGIPAPISPSRTAALGLGDDLLDFAYGRGIPYFNWTDTLTRRSVTGRGFGRAMRDQAGGGGDR